MDQKHSQLNIGTIEIDLKASGGVGAASGPSSMSCWMGELNTGLKAAASGLNDIVRRDSVESGLSILSMSPWAVVSGLSSHALQAVKTG